MTFATKTTCAAALALTASVGLTLPAAAQTSSYAPGARTHHVAIHHAMIRRHAYRFGYVQGFRDGHYAAAMGRVPADLQTGRSAYVGPNIGDASATPPDAAGGNGVFGNGGLLGLGVLGGNGVLGTGVLNGQGALGVGVLGF